MARLAGKARGDMRAMEEQMERQNPVSGRGRRGGIHAVSDADRAVARNKVYGGGATPSMGLSQFRGGMSGCGESESDEEMEGGGFLSDLVGQFNPTLGSVANMVGLGSPDMALPRAVGAGRRRGRGKLTITHGGDMEGGKKGMSEATQMGLHLGKHLHSLHGAGFFDDFKQGFNSVFSPVAKIVKSIAPLAGPEGMAASGVLGALGYGKKGRRRGGATNSDTGAYNGHGRERDDMEMLGMGMLGQDGHGIRQGGGFLSDLGIPVVSQLAGMVGLGHEKDGCGTGAGRRKRAPAGPSDGRRKRAEIVKKVMAEKGLKMIEASKYVKANGLY
jgi:hypothetical protein